MADWSQLGAALAGPDPSAFAKGQHLGAETQAALAQASERVEKQKAQQNLAVQLEAAGFDPNTAAASAGALTAGGGLGDVLTMLGKKQEQGFRATAGAEGSTTEQRNAALAGVASGPVDPFKAVGNRGYQDIFHPDKGILPLGDQVAGSGSDAAAIQVMRAFGMLDDKGHVLPGQEAQAFDIMRSTQKVIDDGGVSSVISANPFARGGGAGPTSGLGDLVAPSPPAAPVATPVSPLSRVVANTAAIASAKKQGEARGEATVALPDSLAEIDKMSGNITKLLGAPGFDSIYGNIAGRVTPVTGVLSQDTANADALRSQLKAETFLQAIQKMRGLGQLSNAEGLKVQDAFTVATTPGISPEMARQSWADVQQYLGLAKTRAATKAGGAPPATATGASPYADPDKEARYQAWKAAQGAQ